MKDITSVHKPDETHVIALTLHALEPFTPWQGIQGCRGKNMSHMCHRPASLGHKERSSGVSHAHRPALGEKWKIHFNRIEVTRHPAPKNSGCKANRDSESGGEVPAPTPWFTGKLCSPPGVWLDWLCLPAATAVVALPTVPIPMWMLPMQRSALPAQWVSHRPEPAPGAWPRLCAPSAWSQLQKQLFWNACETQSSSYFQECASTKG